MKIICVFKYFIDIDRVTQLISVNCWFKFVADWNIKLLHSFSHAGHVASKLTERDESRGRQISPFIHNMNRVIGDPLDVILV